MYRRIVFSVCTMALAATPSASQDSPLSEGSAADVRFTGNIRVDLFGMSAPEPALQIDNQGEVDISGRKSPWLAAGMSLLIPGSGEFYAESYWKAAAFFAVGVTAWTVAYTQNQKGNDQTTYFEGIANEQWDVRKYAQWSYDHATSINPAVDLADHMDVFSGDVGVNWAALNDLERDIGHWYSHTLPAFGEQQYYELIGKYQQYYQGWEDADPSLATYEAVTNKLESGPTQFTAYSAERGKANDYYNTASTAVTVAVLTHVVSAADAAWSASSYNSQFEAGVGFERALDGPSHISYPALQLAFKF